MKPGDLKYLDWMDWLGVAAVVLLWLVFIGMTLVVLLDGAWAFVVFIGSLTVLSVILGYSMIDDAVCAAKERAGEK